VGDDPLHGGVVDGPVTGVGVDHRPHHVLAELHPFARRQQAVGGEGGVGGVLDEAGPGVTGIERAEVRRLLPGHREGWQRQPLAHELGHPRPRGDDDRAGAVLLDRCSDDALLALDVDGYHPLPEAQFGAVAGG
jgi:hypothetical protein